MTLNLTDIEKKALAATKGPYKQIGCDVVGPNDEMLLICRGIALDNRLSKNAAYIAAVSPDVVLKMIEIIRKQQEALGVLSDVYVCDCKEAIKIYRQSGPRAWCCECSNYIRNEDDATFYERVEKARQTLTEVNEVMG